MTIVVRNTGDRWTVEVGGKIVGEANSEANVEEIIASLDRAYAWTPSWRFC